MDNAQYIPTPEGKEWLDSLGPMVLNIALSMDDHGVTQVDAEFKNWQISEIIRQWSKNRPQNIMEAKS